MAGVSGLRKLQLGRESTAGTAVAATTILRSKGTLEDAREQKQRNEHVGYLSAIDNSYQPKLAAKLAQEDSEATFEQLLHTLEAGVMTATPTQDGTGSDYIYVYTMATTAPKTPKSYTIEGGDNEEVEEMEYSLVEDFTLSGNAGEAVMHAANWFGRQLTVSSFTGSLAAPSVEDILFSKGKIYADLVGGTLGATVLANTWLYFSLQVKTGFRPVFTGDGNKYFSFHKQVESEVLLDITFEHDAISKAKKVLWRAETPQQIRLKFEGNAVATPGTTYSLKTLLIDLAGRFEKFDKLGERDGNDVINARFRASYNPTAALFAKFTVVNELTAVP